MTAKHKRRLKRMQDPQYAEIDRQKKYVQRRTTKYKASARARRENEHRLQYMQEYAQRPQRKASIEKWHLEHKVEVRKYKTERAKERRKDPQYRLRLRISCLLRLSLKRNNVRKNRLKSEKILGYSITEIREHLEALFKPGMSWDNMREWHIDHITPHSWLPYTSTSDGNFKILWSLYNLQPLWKEENLKKSNRFAG